MKLASLPALALAIGCGFAAALGPAALAKDPPPTLRGITSKTLRDAARKPAAGRFFANPLPQADAGEELYPYRGGILLLSRAGANLDASDLQRAQPAKAGLAASGTYTYDRAADRWTFVVEGGAGHYRDAPAIARDLARFLYRNPHLVVVLDDPSQRADLTAFCKREGREHYLRFLDEVDAFLAEPTRSGWDKLWRAYLGPKPSKPLDLNPSTRDTLDRLAADIDKQEPSLSLGWALDRIRGVRYEVWRDVEDLHQRWASDAAIEEIVKARIQVTGT